MTTTLPPYSITLLVMNPAGAAPVVSSATPAVDGVSPTGATLHATVSSSSALTDCHFDYGPTTAYGSTAPCTTPLPSGTSPQPVQASISGVTPDTTMRFRLDVTNGGGGATWLPAGVPLAAASGAINRAPTPINLPAGWSLLSEPYPSVHLPRDIADQIGPPGCADSGSTTPRVVSELATFQNGS